MAKDKDDWSSDFGDNPQPESAEYTETPETKKIVDKAIAEAEEDNYGGHIMSFGGEPDDFGLPPLSAKHRQLLVPRPRLPPKVRRTMLGFKHNGMGIYHGFPMVVFKPKGLMIWHIPDHTMLEQFLLGNQEEILAGIEPIPAKFFTMAKSYEQVTEMLEKGIEPPSWGDFDTIIPGQQIRVRLSCHGKGFETAELGMWGYTPENS